MPATPVSLLRWPEVPDRAAVLAEVERIFYEASATKSFPDAPTRARFLERWLTRYLDHDGRHALVALRPDRSVAGYLVGSLVDPALGPRFADIPHVARFKHVSARYPAHLHINVCGKSRGHGIGAALIGRFCREAAEAGTPGVHVVTAQASRNVGFYTRNKFEALAAIRPQVDCVQLFLGRSLVP